MTFDFGHHTGKPIRSQAHLNCDFFIPNLVDYFKVSKNRPAMTDTAALQLADCLPDVIDVSRLSRMHRELVTCSADKSEFVSEGARRMAVLISPNVKADNSMSVLFCNIEHAPHDLFSLAGGDMMESMSVEAENKSHVDAMLAECDSRRLIETAKHGSER